MLTTRIVRTATTILAHMHHLLTLIWLHHEIPDAPAVLEESRLKGAGHAVKMPTKGEPHICILNRLWLCNALSTDSNVSWIRCLFTRIAPLEAKVLFLDQLYVAIAPTMVSD